MRDAGSHSPIECEGRKVHVVVIATDKTEDAQEYQRNVGESFCVHDKQKYQLFSFFQKKFLSSRCTRTSSASTQTVYCRNAP